jgi:hypothetical protein
MRRLAILAVAVAVTGCASIANTAVAVSPNAYPDPSLTGRFGCNADSVMAEFKLHRAQPVAVGGSACSVVARWGKPSAVSESAMTERESVALTFNRDRVVYSASVVRWADTPLVREKGYRIGIWLVENSNMTASSRPPYLPQE